MQDIFLADDLTAIEKVIWDLLQQGTTSYKSAFHYGTVANVQQGRAEARTVILRNVDPGLKKLFFHTDVRSPKVEALKKDPVISWLFYNEPLKLQLRMSANAVIHYKDELAISAWQNLKSTSQLTYSMATAPGEVLEAFKMEAGPEDHAGLLDFAEKNFVVVETTIVTIDFLYLHHAGNRRALFNCVDHTSHWLQA